MILSILAVWSRVHAQRHGDEILEILGDFDNLYRTIRQEEIDARLAKKKKETAMRQQAKRDAQKEQRALDRQARALQPKPPRPPRSKKQLHTVLGDSTTPNVHFSPTQPPASTSYLSFFPPHNLENLMPIPHVGTPPRTPHSSLATPSTSTSYSPPLPRHNLEKFPPVGTPPRTPHHSLLATPRSSHLVYFNPNTPKSFI